MSGLSSRQRELLAASAAVADRTRQGLEAAAGRPPAPGDLFVLDATAEIPVEWLLVDRPDPAGPFLALPGDSHPFLGSTDLEVETTAGTLRLRCGSSAWLGPEALKLEQRVATVTGEDLDRARDRVRALALAEPPANPLLEEIDASPDYQEWLREAVRPAQAAADGAAPAQRTHPPAETTFDRSRLATAALVLLSLGLGGWAIWTQSRLQEIEGRMRASEQAATAERNQQAATVQSLRERLAAAAGGEARADEPLINLPVAILLPEETLRGERPVIHLPPGSPFVVVVLRFPQVPGDPSFRVTLTPEGAASPVWSRDGLIRSAEGSVQLTLPRRLVPPGVYRLELSSRQNGRQEPRGVFRLETAP